MKVRHLVILAMFIGVASVVVFWISPRPEDRPVPATLIPAPAPAPSKKSTLPVEPAPVPIQPAASSKVTMETILSDTSLPHGEAARRLLRLLPQLSEDEQEEAAHHIANLSDEAAVAEWAAGLSNNTLPAPAAEVLFSELYNQPHETLLPALAAMADQTQHPLREESADTLGILLGELPSGSNWTALAAEELRKDSTDR